VQPCLASGLILLLWLGVTRLDESPGAREGVAVAAIVVGVAGIAWAAPERTTEHAGAAGIAFALILVAIPVLAPYALRLRLSPHGRGENAATSDVGALAGLATVAAGCGYAWTAIASKLLTDELAAGTLFVAVVWLASAAASEGLALLSEMSALQRRPATRVAPTMFAVQIVVPVLLAPLIFGEKWGGTPLGGAALLFFVAVTLAGTVLLAGSKTVAAVIESANRDESGLSANLDS